VYKKANFLIFSMIFVAGGAFCQNTYEKTSPDTDLFHSKSSFQVSANYTVSTFFHKKGSVSSVMPIFHNYLGVILNPVSVIGADYYTQNFGFFCKKELQFEKATKIPLRFRLGSLQYNDYLEQKPNAVKPY
jgi:hypothetical protein